MSMIMEPFAWDPRDRTFTFRLTVRGSKPHQPIGYARAIFRVRLSENPKFTANANQSNESVTMHA